MVGRQWELKEFKAVNAGSRARGEGGSAYWRRYRRSVDVGDGARALFLIPRCGFFAEPSTRGPMGALMRAAAANQTATSTASGGGWCSLQPIGSRAWGGPLQNLLERTASWPTTANWRVGATGAGASLRRASHPSHHCRSRHHRSNKNQTKHPPQKMASIL